MSDQFRLKKGDFAPDFTLDTTNDRSVTLSELKGRNVVIYFYPKDNTPGCTRESQEFGEKNDWFDARNTVIIGISKDSIKSHENFKEKYRLPFELAADIKCSVCEAFGVWVEKKNYGKTYMGIQRSTFLINKNGIVENIWYNVKVDGHVQKVAEAVKEL